MSVASIGAGVGGAAKSPNSSGSPDDRDSKKSSVASAGSSVGAKASASAPKSNSSAPAKSNGSAASAGAGVGGAASNSVEGSGGGRGNGGEGNRVGSQVATVSSGNDRQGVAAQGQGAGRNASGSPDDRQAAQQQNGTRNVSGSPDDRQVAHDQQLAALVASAAPLVARAVSANKQQQQQDWVAPMDAYDPSSRPANTDIGWADFQDMVDTLSPGVNVSGSPDDRDIFANLYARRRDMEQNPQAESSLSPIGSLFSGLGDGLAGIAHALNGPYLARQAANGGATPFEGVVDTAGIAHALNGPYLARQAANGGVAPFSGSVDNAGIAAALGLGSVPPDADTNTTIIPAAPSPLSGPTEAQLRAIRDVSGLNAQTRLPATPLPTSATPLGYTPDPRLQADDRDPNGNYAPSSPLTGIDAAVNDVPLPRRDPRGYSDLFSADGQVSTPDGKVLTPGAPVGSHPDSITDGSAVGLPGTASHGAYQTGSDGKTYQYVQKNDSGSWGWEQTTKPSTWDNIVDNGGKILSHTGLGSIVSTLFPDIWNGGGDMMKSLDNGGGSEGASITLPYSNGDGGNGDRDRGTGSLPVTPPVLPFPDVNHNGIDDRLENLGTGTGSSGSTQPVYDRFGQVVFPDMPPYNPGRDDEWLYFRKQMANGGVVGYADGGEVDPLAQADPRVTLIADAEDALHNAVNGTPEPDDGPAIQKFVKTFGEAALEQLKQNVMGGMKMRAPGSKKGRLVMGPGGPKDDAIPAVIDGTQPAALSSGEFVMPAEAVAGAGDGDPAAGAQRMQELSQRFAQQAA